MAIKKTKAKTKKKSDTKEVKNNKKELFANFFKSLEKSSKFNGELESSFTKLKEQEVMPSGFLGLDYGLMAAGGLPIGRISEFWGPSGGSKSTIGMIYSASFVKKGKTVLYVDTEYAINKDYATSLGIDVESGLFQIFQPADGEEGIDTVAQALDAGAIDFIIVDSMKNLTPKKMRDGSAEDHEMGSQARLISKMWQILTARLGKSGATMIVVNQARTNIGGYGAPDKSTGGNATEFYTSVRAKVKKSMAKDKQILDENGNSIGRYTEIVPEKNRMGLARSVTMKLILGAGFCRFHDIIHNALLPLGVIEETSNKRWQYTDKNGTLHKWHGVGQLETSLRELPELFQELYYKSIVYFELQKVEIKRKAIEDGKTRANLVNGTDFAGLKEEAIKMYDSGTRISSINANTEDEDEDLSAEDLDNLPESA
jgi:recombination protein RecA